MRKVFEIILIIYISICFVSPYSVFAQESSPEQIVIDDLTWIRPPPISGLQFSWVKGSEQAHGLYALRVKLEHGTKIPPHTHPDERMSTVLSGTLYVGFGDEFDKRKLISIEQGNVYIAPAQTPHFIWAKDGEVIYQETGIGPTRTAIIKQD